MSIGQHKINSVDSLIENLKLDNVNVNSIDADLYIREIWNIVNKIWENPKDTSFTDHTIDHSCRIMEFFIEFDKLFRWSDYSKLVFTIATLIHDIGMQYEIWRSDDLSKVIKDERAVFPDVDDVNQVYIRENHCELGFKYVYYQIFNEQNVKFMYNMLPNEKYKDLLYQAMYVAYSHSSKSKYFEELRSDHENWNMFTDKDIGYSPRLLAGILRLCDEFDCTFARIKAERLNASEIKTFGRGQWYTCHFITKSKLRISENDISSPKLEISWRVPHNQKEIENKIIKDFIITNRIIKITEEMKTIKKFLIDVNEEAVSKLFDFKINLDKTPSLSSEVSTTKEMNSIMLQYTYKTNSISGIPDPIDTFSDDFEDSQLSEDLFEIRKSLDEWFYECIDPQHYVLETSDHTNILLNCRTLISKHSLIRKIGFFIHKYFSKMGINIDCVLAIGTSAIPFAINYQIFSDCKSTFTMSAKKVIGDTDYDQSEYISTEIIPIIEDSKNILIIDDIISSGDITNKIINKYVFSNGVEGVYYLSLFRLGSRKIERNKLVKKYLWFCHYPWVYYWKENNGEGDKCAYCEQGVHPNFENQQ